MSEESFSNQFPFARAKSDFAVIGVANQPTPLSTDPKVAVSVLWIYPGKSPSSAAPGVLQQNTDDGTGIHVGMKSGGPTVLPDVLLFDDTRALKFEMPPGEAGNQKKIKVADVVIQGATVGDGVFWFGFDYDDDDTQRK